MIKEKAMLLIICVLIPLMFGCSAFYRMTGVSTVVQGPISTPDAQGQLWKTIKGLTPNWLAIPVIALGAVALWNGAGKLGMSCVIFGSVNLFMALATSRFGFWMAVCGMIGSVCAVAASILAKNKALKEMIFGVQEIKELQDPESKLPVVRSILNKQTKSTQKLVKKIKNDLRLKGQLE